MKSMRFSARAPRLAATVALAAAFLLGNGSNWWIQAGAAESASKPGQTMGVTDTEIRIGSCSALEGPASALGRSQLAGARAYIDHINDGGGVHGRKIRLLTFDDGYEPVKAIEAFKKMMAANVFAGAFFVGTPTAAKHVPLAETNGIPIVGLFTGADLLHDPFRPHVISVRASYNDETREQIDHLWNDLGAHKIAVIYQDDAFGDAVLSGVRRALRKYSAAPIALGSFQRNTVDVNDAIAVVRKKKPDAVIMAGSYEPLAQVVKRSHAEHWHPIFTTVSFVGTEAFIKAAGTDADGTVITQVVPPYYRDDLPTVSTYKRMLAKYSPQESPNFASLEGYVDAMVLVEGLQRAGTNLTRDNFISAIEGIQNKDMGLGPTLKLSYGHDDHQGFDDVYFSVVRTGRPIAFRDWRLLKH